MLMLPGRHPGVLLSFLSTAAWITSGSGFCSVSAPPFRTTRHHYHAFQSQQARPSRTMRMMTMTVPSPEEVYVLELADGFVYVGKSKNVTKRVHQHMLGRGASFTKYHRPTGKVLPRLGTLHGKGDGPERDETLRQMNLRGVDMVRGWKYCGRFISAEEKASIEDDMRELFDLCRRCGGDDHFARQCRCLRDRLGSLIIDR